MITSISLIEGVLVMMATILLGIFLKWLKLLKQDHSSLFSRLVLNVTLPALILSSLAVTEFQTRYLYLAGIMAVVELVCIFLAWAVAKLIHLKRDETGALILVSAFGMSTMLAYPLIGELFPGNKQAMEEAVITSEFGVGFLLFILGPGIAMYYGQSGFVKGDLRKSAGRFFISPIFISLVLGIAISFLNINQDDHTFKTFGNFLNIIAAANTLLVSFAVGLIVEIQQMKKYILFLAVAILLKLIIKPLLSYWFTGLPVFTEMMREIIFIETAMPSALLAAVFAKHYNCRPELVSGTVIVTLLLSIVTVSLLFLILFN